MDNELLIDIVHKNANDRKRIAYWIGFLEGALASGRIETGEDEALLAEADKFAEFFDDPDASDLAEDIRAKCFSGQNDMISALNRVVEEKRHEFRRLGPNTDLDDVNEFLGFCAGVICDGKVLEKEAAAMLTRFRQSDVLQSSPLYRDLWRALESALADGSLSPAETEDLREWISLLVGSGFVDTGLPNIGNVAQFDQPIVDPAAVALAGHCFVLTGPMLIGPRNVIIRQIESCGGTVASATSRKTDYVVIASNASRNWTTTHYGTKIEKAKKLISEGYKLRFVTEHALAGALKQHSAL